MFTWVDRKVFKFSGRLSGWPILLVGLPTKSPTDVSPLFSMAMSSTRWLKTSQGTLPLTRQFPLFSGNAREFCTHGNEVDAWNYVRYEDLAATCDSGHAGSVTSPVGSIAHALHAGGILWVIASQFPCRSGTGADIAKAARSVTSDNAGFMTGEVLVIAGGWTAFGYY
jgi:hypothetical protein